MGEDPTGERAVVRLAGRVRGRTRRFPQWKGARWGGWGHGVGAAAAPARELLTTPVSASRRLLWTQPPLLCSCFCSPHRAWHPDTRDADVTPAVAVRVCQREEGRRRWEEGEGLVHDGGGPPWQAAAALRLQPAHANHGDGVGEQGRFLVMTRTAVAGASSRRPLPRQSTWRFACRGPVGGCSRPMSRRGARGGVSPRGALPAVRICTAEGRGLAGRCFHSAARQRAACRRGHRGGGGAQHTEQTHPESASTCSSVVRSRHHRRPGQVD